MGKAFCLLLGVLAVWAWLEVAQHGTAGAFGGRLAGVFAPLEPAGAAPAAETGPLTDRVRERVEGVMADYERDRLGRASRAGR